MMDPTDDEPFALYHIFLLSKHTELNSPQREDGKSLLDVNAPSSEDNWNQLPTTDPPVSGGPSGPTTNCGRFLTGGRGIWDVEVGLILRMSTVSDCKRNFSSSLDSWWKCSVCDLHFCSRSWTLTFDRKWREQEGGNSGRREGRERKERPKYEESHTPTHNAWDVLHYM